MQNQIWESEKATAKGIGLCYMCNCDWFNEDGNCVSDTGCMQTQSLSDVAIHKRMEGNENGS